MSTWNDLTKDQVVAILKTGYNVNTYQNSRTGKNETYYDGPGTPNNEDGYRDYDNPRFYKYGLHEDTIISGAPSLPVLAEEYGGEGQGDDYWFVLKLDDRYLKFEGWYASYDGGYIEWDDCYWVNPEEYTATRWVKVTD